eukprot:126045-Rhodomonas_salina.8
MIATRSRRARCRVERSVGEGDADPLRKKWEEAVEEIRRVEENRTERGGLSDGVWREGAACRVSWTQD